MPTSDRQYHSFLLRLWEAKRNGRIVWRCSLQSARTRQLVNFDSLDSMVSYLLTITADSPVYLKINDEGGPGDGASRDEDHQAASSAPLAGWQDKGKGDA